ncbi:tetratricopeptide (TPR) repeat protein [Actinomadura coerulea]|uniref:Tetratricopeptide (TPR) repeat protein n=1 Tax=Actinomadura coerulea TaxID=46159 RepID=A0A7X0G2Q1_9ACTN|nr:hypothetical protein [Actinomadura coerulea]MBB6398307.1 tetratricopeptide (TPR) repeat protein [Actinomadura coerulea]GGQ10635.1 hypothetical protein GCM10010187_28610 [Actinomadura coerulea]
MSATLPAEVHRNMSSENAVVGARLRAARKAAGLTVADVAERWRDLAPIRVRRQLPALKDLERTIRGHEAGEHVPGPRYRLLWAQAVRRSQDELFAADTTASPRPTPAANRGEPGDYAATVRDTSQHLIMLDSRFGGTAIADLAVRAFLTARSALATGRHNSDERDLQAAAGEAGEIAAWTLYDADRLGESRATIHEAMLLSRLAGDRSMELFELSHLALLDVHQRHSREALSIAEHTIDGPALPPRVEALFKLRAARALAQGGDRGRAVAILDQAAGALQESLHPKDPHWTWWLDSSELAWHRGILHMELGDIETAMPYLDEAAHGRLERDPYMPTLQAGPVMARGEEWGRAAYNDLVHLQLALTIAKAWRETEAITATVFDFTREVVSARTEVMLRAAVRSVLRAGRGRGGPSSTLTDLAEQIAEGRGWDVGKG